MIPDTSQGPGRLMVELMAREIEREKARLSFTFDAPANRLSLGGSAPGVLSFSEPYGSYKEVSFVIGMRLLAALPPREGSLPARRVLSKAWNEGTASPIPRNDPAWVQVGDILGKGRVTGITVGHDYDSAKNGREVRSLPRQALTSASTAERTILSVDGPEGGWWRRGTQVASLLQKPAREGRGELRRLRRDHALLQRDYDETFRQVRRGDGSPEKLLAYHGMLTASRRMLETAGREPGPADRAERTLVRQRVRDLKALTRELRKEEYWGNGAADKAEKLAKAELAAFRDRRSALDERIEAASERTAAPAP